MLSISLKNVFSDSVDPSPKTSVTSFTYVKNKWTLFSKENRSNTKCFLTQWQSTSFLEKGLTSLRDVWSRFKSEISKEKWVSKVL